MADAGFHAPKGRPSRKVPKPFQRPTVHINRTSREWRRVPVLNLSAGDTVAGVGLLSSVTKLETVVIVNNVFDGIFEWPLDKEVLAFVCEE